MSTPWPSAAHGPAQPSAGALVMYSHIRRSPAIASPAPPALLVQCVQLMSGRLSTLLKHIRENAACRCAAELRLSARVPTRAQVGGCSYQPQSELPGCVVMLAPFKCTSGKEPQNMPCQPLPLADEHTHAYYVNQSTRAWWKPCRAC